LGVTGPVPHDVTETLWIARLLALTPVGGCEPQPMLGPCGKEVVLAPVSPAIESPGPESFGLPDVIALPVVDAPDADPLGPVPVEPEAGRPLAAPEIAMPLAVPDEIWLPELAPAAPALPEAEASLSRLTVAVDPGPDVQAQNPMARTAPNPKPRVFWNPSIH